MKMKVYRNALGEVINIGEWDYQIHRAPVIDPASGQEIFDQLPGGGLIQRMKQVAGNPLPEGAYEDDAEVEVAPDGGLRALK